LLFTLGLWHKNFCHKAEEAVDNGVVETVVENIPEEPTVEEIPEAEAKETETSSKKSTGKNYGSVKNPVDKITDVTHKSSTEKPSVETTAGDVPADIKVVDNRKEEEDTKKAVEEAEKNGDNVKELDNGIIAIEKNEETKTDDSKKDQEKVDLKEEEKESAEEVPSNTEEKVEEVKDTTDCIEDATDKDLEDMLDSTTKNDTTEEKTEEPATGKTEVNDLTITEEKEQPVVPVKPVEKEEPAKEEIKPVEPVKTVKAVSVSAIDGYATTVGSQIQFRVDGDDVKIEGLDGINYSFSNGVLTVDAGNEATVLSVSISNSVNTVNFDITVNGVLQ